MSEQTVKVYDARGNGGGAIAPTLAGDHQNRVTDYTAIVLMRRFSDVRVYTNGISPTIENRAGGGGGNLPMILQNRNENISEAKTSEK